MPEIIWFEVVPPVDASGVRYTLNVFPAFELFASEKVLMTAIFPVGTV